MSLSVIAMFKTDMGIKDDVLYLLYDTLREEVCPYYFKFTGNLFYLVYSDKSEECGTKVAYQVLDGMFVGLLVPINSRILFLGRKRGNYHEDMVRHFMARENVSFGKEFMIGEDCCVIYRNGKFYRNGDEDITFFFNQVFKGAE